MHKIVKRVIVGAVVVALAGTGAAAGLLQLRKNNQKEVMVTSVSNLVSDYFMPTTSIDGSVTTSVAQNVSVDSDMIIDQVYVAEGDTVKKGEPLISFDTTLVEMELNIARLKHKKLEQDLNRAVNRLNSLKNGGPILEEDGGGSADNLDNMDVPDDTDDEMASLTGQNNSDTYLAAAVPRLLLSAFVDGELEEEPDADGSGTEDPAQAAVDEALTEPEYQDPSAGDFTSGEEISDGNSGDDITSGQNDVPKPSPTPTPELDENTSYYDPYFTDEMEGVTDGREKFYDKLDSNSVPFTGTGTEKDPLVFLVSSARGGVTAMGSFFNKMAGYSEDGTKVEKEGGYWFQLEFHQNDTIGDYQDRTLSCTGYYLINGSFLTQPVYEYVESEFTLSDAMTYEPQVPDEPGTPGGGTGTTTVSREEAIKYQQRKIANLKLDIQESNIKIGKLEKKVNRKLISSKLDGIVTYVGDTVTKKTDGSTFIKVKSGDGYYVVGAVSELFLDQIGEGTVLNCISYDKGEFEAKVMEVSEYPISGSVYAGMSNPNASYYSLTAEVLDKSIKFRDYDYITINLESSQSVKGSLVLQKAFVRTENGKSYVYKDDKGVLKKQYLTVGGNVDNGYSVLVKDGITTDDLIAFPYGKTVVEGAKTKEVTLDQMYGYNG
ncbi:MAG: hypothetical protein UFJ18_03215 [Blautia sp.]|nr:hypothetical protein [Blautia sp.]